MKLLHVGIILTVLILSEARNEEDGRIVAAYSTKTAFSITTSTTTIPLTCASAGSSAVCRKRRFRRFPTTMDMVVKDLKYQEHSLDGTLGDDPDVGISEDRSVNKEEEEDKSRKGKIAITVWTTRSSTYTVTSTSINSALTFSISYYCTFAGANMAPPCG